MRILMVDGALPCREASAGERATFDLLDGLFALGHEVDFTALGTVGDMPARRQAMTDRGIAVLPGAGGGLSHLAEVLDTGYDLVIVHRPGPALAASGLLARTSAATVHFGHDIHQWRLAAQNELTHDVPTHTLLVTQVAERRCWAGYDLSVYPTQREADHINGLPDRQGAAVAFPYYRLPPEDLRRVWKGDGTALLMVGGSMHAPNRDAVAFAAAEILPLIGRSLTVVGDWPAGERTGLPVRFTGRVSEQRLRELHASHLALLAPLRFGAGSRRKLVAAMALGLPVITTPEGSRGLLVRDANATDGLAVAESPAQFAAAVAATPDRGEDMAAAAFDRVSGTYSAAAYDRALADVISLAISRRDERLSG